MPTGYTCKVGDGEVSDLKTFAMDCARAFGACISLREEPLGGELIPVKFEPSPFYAEMAAKNEQELIRVWGMTEEEAEKLARKEWEAALNGRLHYIQKTTEENARFNAMIEKVQAWQPPTPDHENLKTFMLDQLAKSIHHPIIPELPPFTEGGKAWKATRIRALEEEIKRYRESHAEEVARAETRTKWVNDLRRSLS